MIANHFLKLASVFICLFFSTFLTAQEFKGTVTDSNSNPVSNCYIILINADNNETIDYIVPNENGKYSVAIKKSILKNIIVKCQGMGYVSQIKNVELKTNNYIYNVDFSLKSKEIVLDEIIVLSERVALKIKNDTVVYDVSKFKRVQDRKIINVLKNMPGIQVDERTGIIQYKGKPIETLLLDGDDLFGKGYSIGARNISSDQVDKVEAIEDYHGNKLKKGFKRSDDVVLNLKFKKDNFKISGEVSAAGGKKSHLANTNIMNLSRDIKGFGVVNSNTVSINQTSFYKETYASENRDEIENSSIDLFNESSITQTAAFPKSYINNLKFGTFSNLYKISDKIKLTNTISFFNDLSRHSFISRNHINIDNNIIHTSNHTFNNSNPFYITLANDVNIDLSKASILKFSNRLVSNNNLFNQENIQNEGHLYNAQINQSKLYYQQKLTYTKKITNNDLIELSFFNSNDTKNQDLLLLNNQNIIYNGNLFNKIDFKSNRESFSGTLTYLKRIKKWDFEITAGQKTETEVYTINTHRNDDYEFINNISNLVTNTNFEITRKIKLSGKLDLGYSLRNLFTSLESKNINEKELFVNSEVKLKFKINNSFNLTMNFENNNKPNDTYYLFSNPVLVDSRTIINSIPSLKFQKNWKSYVNLSHYNLLKQSSLTFMSSYEEIQNTIIAKQIINEDINIITYFQTPQTKRDLNLTATRTFFIDAINNKISVNGNANFGLFYNALNGNNLNKVWTSIYNTNIEINSAFDGFFNYKSTVGLTYIESKQEYNTPFYNHTVNAKFEAIFQFTKNMYSKIENEGIFPKGMDFTQNQLFVDFSFNYKKENTEYFILSRNLLNNSSFNQFYITEFSTSTFSNNLFKRYILFGLSYSF